MNRFNALKFKKITRTSCPLLALLVLVSIPVSGCRLARSGNSNDIDALDVVSERRDETHTAGRLMPGGDPRVTLVNAPCGNSAETGVFLARARTLNLVNKLVKLPAAAWKLSLDGRKVPMCSFMAAGKIDLALVHVMPRNCGTCDADVMSLAQSLRALNSNRPSGGGTVKVIAVDSGVTVPRVAGDGLPLVYTADPEATLLSTLASPSDPALAPVFVVHKSGFGFFSNTPGKERDAVRADFEALSKSL